MDEPPLMVVSVTAPVAPSKSAIVASTAISDTSELPEYVAKSDTETPVTIKLSITALDFAVFREFRSASSSSCESLILKFVIEVLTFASKAAIAWSKVK